MKKLLALLGTLLCMGSVSFAQTTTVSGTVIDSDGTTWTNGTISAQFVPNPSQQNISIYNINGVPLSQAVTTQGPISLGGAGTFSFSVYQNAAITPSGSTWQYTICPNASTKCGVFTIAAVGSTQSLTSMIPAIIPAPRFLAVAGAYGYADIETINQQPVGGTYWNTSASCQKYYNSLSWNCIGTVGGAVIAVTASAPIVSSGGTTPNITCTTAGTSTTGCISSTDWNTFNNKQVALGFTPYNATNPAGYITNSVTTLPSLTISNTQVSGLGTASTHPYTDFEAALGNPASTGYVLSSTTLGVRSWVPQNVGISSINGGTGAYTFNGPVVSCVGTTCTFTDVNPGTVTTVGLVMPSIFTVINSPVTTTGALTASLNSQQQNLFLASPNGSSGVPTFRAIVAADVPILNQNTTGTAANVTGTVLVANGGTGASTAAGAWNNITGGTDNGASGGANVKIVPGSFTAPSGVYAGTSVTNGIPGIIGGGFAAGGTSGSVIQNKNAAGCASTEYAALNDLTTGAHDHYSSFGINSSIFSCPSSNIAGPNQGYFQCQTGSDCFYGTMDASPLHFIYNGTIHWFDFDGTNLIAPTIKSSSGFNCLQINASGNITNTGSACAAGGGGGMSGGFVGSPVQFGSSTTGIPGAGLVNIPGVTNDYCIDASHFKVSLGGACSAAHGPTDWATALATAAAAQGNYILPGQLEQGGGGIYVGSPVTFNNANGIGFIGVGAGDFSAGATNIIYGGSTNGPFLFTGVNRDVIFRDMQINSLSPTTSGAAIGVSVGGTTVHWVFDNVRIYNFFHGLILTGQDSGKFDSVRIGGLPWNPGTMPNGAMSPWMVLIKGSSPSSNVFNGIALGTVTQNGLGIWCQNGVGENFPMIGDDNSILTDIQFGSSVSSCSGEAWIGNTETDSSTRNAIGIMTGQGTSAVIHYHGFYGTDQNTVNPKFLCAYLANCTLDIQRTFPATATTSVPTIVASTSTSGGSLGSGVTLCAVAQYEQQIPTSGGLTFNHGPTGPEVCQTTGAGTTNLIQFSVPPKHGMSDIALYCGNTGSEGLCAGAGDAFGGTGRMTNTGGSAVEPLLPAYSYLGAISSGTYTSGIAATGTAGQTCNLTFDNTGTATVALTGTNTINGGTALTILTRGTMLYQDAPVTATVSAGTASACTGPATVAVAIAAPPPPVYLNFQVKTTPTPGASPVNTSTYIEPMVSMGDASNTLQVLGPMPYTMGIQYMAVSSTGTYFNPFNPSCTWVNGSYINADPVANQNGALYCGIPPTNNANTPSFYGFAGLNEAQQPTWFQVQSGIHSGVPTYTAGTNVTSCAQTAGNTNSNQRGSITIVGGTATTGTICTVNFSQTLGKAPKVEVNQNGGATLFSIGHGNASTASFTVTAGISVVGQTVVVDYESIQ